MNLLVNIDHVATLRNARGEGYPDPVEAAKMSENAGVAGIVFHLRGDRRHIKDDDVYRLKQTVKGRLNFEMAATNEMIALCREIKPNLCTLVPEGRLELTTEGGLNMQEIKDDFKKYVFPELHEKGIEISLFLDPNPEDIEIAHYLGADNIELHTGTFANAADENKKQELERLKQAAIQANHFGIKVSAGHGLNLENLPALLDAVPFLHEVSIGHALISKSVFWGLEKTISAYLDVLKSYKLHNYNNESTQ